MRGNASHLLEPGQPGDRAKLQSLTQAQHLDFLQGDEAHISSWPLRPCQAGLDARPRAEGVGGELGHPLAQLALPQLALAQLVAGTA